MALKRRVKKRHGDLKATGIRGRARADRLPREHGGITDFPTAENTGGDPAEISRRLNERKEQRGPAAPTVPRHLRYSPFSTQNYH
jgi:hypothetical protein